MDNPKECPLCNEEYEGPGDTCGCHTEKVTESQLVASLDTVLLDLTVIEKCKEDKTKSDPPQEVV